ncbi:hypothetical protein CBL_05544 [Carabus blaptoides fortunei]
MDADCRNMYRSETALNNVSSRARVIESDAAWRSAPANIRCSGTATCRAVKLSTVGSLAVSWLSSLRVKRIGARGPATQPMIAADGSLHARHRPATAAARQKLPNNYSMIDSRTSQTSYRCCRVIIASRMRRDRCSQVVLARDQANACQVRHDTMLVFRALQQISRALFQATPSLLAALLVDHCECNTQIHLDSVASTRIVMLPHNLAAQLSARAINHVDCQSRRHGAPTFAAQQHDYWLFLQSNFLDGGTNCLLADFQPALCCFPVVYWVLPSVNEQRNLYELIV